MTRRLVCDFRFTPGALVRHRVAAANSISPFGAVGVVTALVVVVKDPSMHGWGVLYDVQWPSASGEGLHGQEIRHHEYELEPADPDPGPDHHAHHAAAPTPAR